MWSPVGPLSCEIRQGTREGQDGQILIVFDSSVFSNFKVKGPFPCTGRRQSGSVIFPCSCRRAEASRPVKRRQPLACPAPRTRGLRVSQDAVRVKGVHCQVPRVASEPQATSPGEKQQHGCVTAGTVLPPLPGSVQGSRFPGHLRLWDSWMARSCLPASPPWSARTFPRCPGCCFFSYPCCLKPTSKTKVLSIPLYQFPESSPFMRFCFWARCCYFCISLGEEMPEDRTGRLGLCPAQPGRQM